MSYDKGITPEQVAEKIGCKLVAERQVEYRDPERYLIVDGERCEFRIYTPPQTRTHTGSFRYAFVDDFEKQEIRVSRGSWNWERFRKSKARPDGYQWDYIKAAFDNHSASIKHERDIKEREALNTKVNIADVRRLRAKFPSMEDAINVSLIEAGKVRVKLGTHELDPSKAEIILSILAA